MDLRLEAETLLPAAIMLTTLALTLPNNCVMLAALARSRVLLPVANVESLVTKLVNTWAAAVCESVEFAAATATEPVTNRLATCAALA